MKKNIMIIEDDENTQIFYREIFEAHDDKYAIEIISDARMAYNKLKEKPVDVIVLDIIMEPMDGEVFFTCMRSNKKISNIPVLISSVLRPEKIITEIRPVNVDFIKKPFTSEEFFKKIEKMIK